MHKIIKRPRNDKLDTLRVSGRRKSALLVEEDVEMSAFLSKKSKTANGSSMNHFQEFPKRFPEPLSAKGVTWTLKSRSIEYFQ